MWGGVGEGSGQAVFKEAPGLGKMRVCLQGRPGRCEHVCGGHGFKRCGTPQGGMHARIMRSSLR